jgi:hypothetical protein
MQKMGQVPFVKQKKTLVKAIATATGFSTDCKRETTNKQKNSRHIRGLGIKYQKLIYCCIEGKTKFNQISTYKWCC